MATDPLKAISTRATPQSQKVTGRTDQVMNNAGGAVFEVDKWQMLDRFLILGSFGGTYYVSEQKLTQDQVNQLFALIAEDGERVVRRVVEISTSGRAPKNQPALFALAAVSAKGSNEAKALAHELLPQVARTGTHLFTFVGYCEQMRGWGRSLRSAIAGWYTDKDVDRLAFQLIKYRQREGWSHRDLLRLSHPKTEEEARKIAFAFGAGKIEAATGVDELKVIDAFLEAQSLDITNIDRAVELITDARLPWEALPTEMHNEPRVWEALLPHMGQTALIRQLPRLTRLGLIDSMGSETTTQVTSMLTDEERLVKGRIHPVVVLNALMTYGKGRSMRGSSTWTPSQKVVDALDAAFYLSFGAVEPANKRTLMALDVSGSMAGASVAGLDGLTAREASAAMAMVTIATEPAVETVAFTGGARNRGYFYGGRYGEQNTDVLTPLSLSARQRLDDVIKTISNLPFAGTDCSLPMMYAKEKDLKVEAFHVYTDSETWAGTIHPYQALNEYRQASGIDARLIVYGMSGTPFTIADPRDPGMMDCVGLDSSAPQIAADFAAGKL